MKFSESLTSEYLFRINKSLDYIESNKRDVITLEELSKAANFSKYHFSRIFQSIIGETPFQFILRVRLEKAASLLLSNKRKSISEISLQCGFSDISIFSRNFKKYYKISPSQYRVKKYYNSNQSQQESNNEQKEIKSTPYFCSNRKLIENFKRMELNKSIKVVELPRMTVAYIRNIGPYNGDQNMFQSLKNKLFIWAESQGWSMDRDFKFLVVYHDDPTVTISNNLRMSLCISIPNEAKTNSDIGKMEIEAAKYVVARFSLIGKEFQEAWKWLYEEWMPYSGYEPDDKPYFEMYCEAPKKGNYLVDFCIPVKRI